MPMDAYSHAPTRGLPAVLDVPRAAALELRGFVGERMRANVEHWLLQAPQANPAMLQMFRDRDRVPHRDLVPWAGEFAGKYLISAAQALRLTRDPRLRQQVRAFVGDLIATQDADGYLGPFPKAEGMLGKGRWDLWGQYHVMLGLLRWHQETGDREALAACRRCADLFCRTFLDTGRRVLHAGSEEMNESSIHIFTLLHRETGEPRYLRMAREIERDWETPPSGDHVRAALAGRPFWQHPKPRWESLHGIQAIAELHWITGDERYRRAFDAIWWSIVEGDRHCTGGFSSGEQATGNPYDPRPIETCCTIAWMAITLDQLRLTGDPRAADELELSLWNAVLGAQHPSGRWWTYNTPMDGERKASAHDIVFQARAGSPELNCCSVNAPRGLGILGEWAVMQRRDGLVVNFYGPFSADVRLARGRVRLEMRTAYPLDGKVELIVRPDAPARFPLLLRIPGWCRLASVRAAEGRGETVRGSAYAEIDRKWEPGDRVEMDLDLGPWTWVGERECAGKAALYRGPLLLACDARIAPVDPRHLPVVDPARPPRLVDPRRAGIPAPLPLLCADWPTVGGGALRLVDFASAGAAGNPYASWLPAQGFAPVPFSRENPLRAVWPLART